MRQARVSIDHDTLAEFGFAEFQDAGVRDIEILSCEGARGVSRIHQTFVYDGQTFILDSFVDWEPYEVEANRFAFTHTDPPKPKGKTFEVTWDTVYTAAFDNPCVDAAYEEGDRHAGFPFESSYEIVAKDE